ncbi:MAG: sigma factor-like helix-turn-helix DNA-binding protein, partial [Thermodesulfobacteriota bacterium]
MSTTASDRLRGAELRRQCVELRRSGLTYEEIGKQVGITPQGAHKHVKRALEALASKTAEDA